MSRQLPADDSEKIARMNQSKSPGSRRLESFQIPKSAQTPPTRLSISNTEPKVLLLLDKLNGHIVIAKFLQIWRLKTMNRRKKRSIFQESLSRPDFDLEPKIGTISECKERLMAMKASRTLKNETLVKRESQTAAALLFRRILCKYFGKWQSELIRKMTTYAKTQRHKCEFNANARAPDLLGKLHALITKRAELETELEARQNEADDISSVIQDNKRQLVAVNEQIQEQKIEHARVQELKRGIDSDYKDQIATLRMLLRKECDTRQEKIEEAQKRIKLQMKAREATSETIHESKESLQVRLGELNQKLASAQSIAVQIRDELLTSEDEQASVASDIIAMKMEISRLNQECDALRQKRESSTSMIGDNLESLKTQYHDIMKELKQTKDLIDQYNQQLVDQDGRIDILSRELALAKQRRRTTMDAFNDKEFEPNLQ